MKTGEIVQWAALAFHVADPCSSGGMSYNSESMARSDSREQKQEKALSTSECEKFIEK